MSNGGSAQVSLSDVEILNRQPLGDQWIQVRGLIHKRLVSVDVPKARLFGLDDRQSEDQMKRALRAALPYARE